MPPLLSMIIEWVFHSEIVHFTFRFQASWRFIQAFYLKKQKSMDWFLYDIGLRRERVK